MCIGATPWPKAKKENNQEKWDKDTTPRGRYHVVGTIDRLNIDEEKSKPKSPSVWVGPKDERSKAIGWVGEAGDTAGEAKRCDCDWEESVRRGGEDIVCAPVDWERTEWWGEGTDAGVGDDLVGIAGFSMTH